MHSDVIARVLDSADWGECPRSHVIHVQAVKLHGWFLMLNLGV